MFRLYGGEPLEYWQEWIELVAAHYVAGRGRGDR
jgi:hypothetical protein